MKEEHSISFLNYLLILYEKVWVLAIHEEMAAC